MTTASGIVSWQAEAAAFGETRVDSDIANSRLAAVNNHRFPGQYYDVETGLSYNYFRDYEASVGRYVERDPIGLRGGVNVYGYVEGNPVGIVDPFGLWLKRCSRKLGSKEEPPVKPSGNPLRHDYLSASGSIYSFQAGGGAWGMVWSQGSVESNEYPDNSDCVVVCDDDRIDAFVAAAAAEIGEPNYNVVAYPGVPTHAAGARNCQTWADDVIKLALKMYREAVDCPEC